MYEITEHTADVGIRIATPTLEGLFADAARGLFSLIVEDLDSVRLQTEVRLDVAGRDPEYLLFDWLSELLFTFETRRLLLRDFTVRFEEGRGLHAVVRGEPVDAARHRLEHEVKAITYHGLDVHEGPAGWEAAVIVDV